jgi:hypothetical protein
MNFYRRLKLPLNPLKNSDSFINQHMYNRTFRDSYMVESQDNLTDETLELLSLTKLDIDFIIVFRTFGELGPAEDRYIHSDLQWRREWKNLPFGVNWEIGYEKNHAVFQWWDMSAYEPKYPPITHAGDKTFSKLTGLHYGQYNIKGVPEKAKLLEEVETSRPLLVRTDMPHSVVFSSQRRMAISVRFKQLLDWNSTLTAFSPLILE